MDIAAGEAFYFENCAACHGDTGFGDGAMTPNLPGPAAPLADLAYSLQETAFAMLVEVSERALAHTGKKELLQKHI